MRQSPLVFEELARPVVQGGFVVAGIALGAVSGGWRAALLAAFLYGFLGLCSSCLVAPRAVFRSGIYSRQARYHRTGQKSSVGDIILMPVGAAIGSWVVVWLANRLGFSVGLTTIWVWPAILTSVCAPFGIVRLLWAEKWWLRQYGK